MIPLSKDQKLKYLLDGVTYSFHPPIEEIEVFLQNHFGADDAMLKKAKELLPVARKALEKEYKENKTAIPPKKEWEVIVSQRLSEIMKEKGFDIGGVENVIKEKDEFINTVLCGWESKLPIPKFDLENPSKGLSWPLKNKLYAWYLNQYTLTDEEVKN
jgi:hypothetical protein